ncbi:hypothetical protein [Aliiroseovarius crassostreae]|uniref:hypothetical protein n=1 Tax=Aliiroseovarius crassostreae TaxID=154981 RepID=UPI0011143FAA|nr:hypothetical protein [Aliiroseovarius crassostreae]
MQILDMRNPCDPIQKRKITKGRRDYTPEQVKEIAWHVFNPPVRQIISLEGLSGREKQAAALKAGHATQEHDQLVELCSYMGILFLTMARPAPQLSNRAANRVDCSEGESPETPFFAKLTICSIRSCTAPYRIMASFMDLPMTVMNSRFRTTSSRIFGTLRR